MTLYEITEAMKQVEAMLETDVDASAFMEGIKATEEEKLEGMCRLIRQKEAEANAKREEAERMMDSAKSDEATVQRIKFLIHQHLIATSQEKAKAGLFTVSRQKNGGSRPLTVEGEAWKEDDRFKVLTVAMNKTAIKQALEAGEDIPWARLEERGESVRIK